MSSNQPSFTNNAEVVVIGSGIGGLSCAAILARYGIDVTVVESHSIAGGAAHAFERNGYQFDSGPSLYSGLSYTPSPNPLPKILGLKPRRSTPTLCYN